VNPVQHIGQPFLIPRQQTESAHSADVPLDHPASGQQHEGPFGFSKRDDDQVDAVVSRCLPGAVPSGSLIDLVVGHG
jgi:hypothetical protein